MKPDEVPAESFAAAYAARYGEPVDTYTWDLAADAVLKAAAPGIRADERERIAQALEREASEMVGERAPNPFTAAAAVTRLDVARSLREQP